MRILDQHRFQGEQREYHCSCGKVLSGNSEKSTALKWNRHIWKVLTDAGLVRRENNQ
jgi:hypothetical protein